MKDRPGIIASIAAALSERGINIDAMLQKSGFTKAELYLLSSRSNPAALPSCAKRSTNQARAEFLRSKHRSCSQF